MVKFLHTSDWHLGMRRHFLTEESEPRYRQDRIEAVRAMGRIAAEEECAFMVVAGDVLDSNQIDPRTVSRAAEALRDVPVPVYLLPGNHDAADASSMLCSGAFERVRPENVFVLKDAGAVTVAPGVELVAAPWRTRRPLSDLVGDACRGLEPGPIRILLGHGAVDVLAPDKDDPALVDVARAEAALASGTVHYVALGDRHSATSVGRTGRIWYSGTPEPTAFDEARPGEVLVVRLDREGIEVRPRQVGHWTFRRLEQHLAGPEDVAAFRDALGALPNKERTALRLAVTGTLTLQAHAAYRAVLDQAGDLFAALTVSEGRSDLVVVPHETDFGDLELAGFAREALVALRSSARAGGPDAETARDALGLLVRLAGRAS